MASMAELHESWTLSQFTELLRAAHIARLPDEVEDAAWWQEHSRWEFLPDALAIGTGISIYVPLMLEQDPSVSEFSSEKFALWLQQTLRNALQGRAVEELVSLARRREAAVLTRLQSLTTWAPEKRARVDDRLAAIEHAVPFESGAPGCDLERGVDLSTEQAMLTDLQALADTCPQRQLIRFLRAAAFLTKVPERLADPGARLDRSVLRRVEDELSLASRTIAGFASLVQRDPLVRGQDTVPQRLAAILQGALQARRIGAVIPDGERLERAFLLALRQDLSARLRAEMEERRARTAEPGTVEPTRPSHTERSLRESIERVGRRLALLGSAER